MKIADIEIIELQNIPVTPPLFKQPLRTGARILKITTDDGIVGISQIAGSMYSATAAFILKDLAPFLKGQTPLENERLMHQMLWKFNNRAHAGIWNFAVSAVDVALWDNQRQILQNAGVAVIGRRAEIRSGLHHLWLARL